MCIDKINQKSFQKVLCDCCAKPLLKGLYRKVLREFYKPMKDSAIPLCEECERHKDEKYLNSERE